jgi:hypothetical protein
MAEEIGALRAVLALESAAFDRGVQSARRQLGTLGSGLDATGRQVQQFGQRMSRDATAGFRSVQQSSGAAGAGLQNFGFQVQDMAVQIAGGTSATRAMAQQLPQLLSGFGLFGVAIGTASAVLIPLIGYLFQAGEATKSWADELSLTAGSISNVQSAVSALESVQRQYVDAITAQGGASSAAAALVIANSAREFAARKQLLAVELELLRIRGQEQAQARQNIADQLAGAASYELGRIGDARRRGRQSDLLDEVGAFDPTVANEGPSAVRRATGALADGATLVGDVFGAFGRAAEGRERDILAVQKLNAELELTNLTIERTDALMNTTFETISGGGSVAPAAGGGGGGGGGRRRGGGAPRAAAEIANVRVATEEVGKAAQQLHSTLGTAFVDLVTGAKSFSEALSEVASQLAKMLAQSAFNGLFGGGGLLSGIFGGGGGRVAAFASGGVVNGPTLFPMANGTGLMGEAGPEAIMPLTRVGGKLGVRAAGGGGTVINVDARYASEGTADMIVRAIREAAPGLMQGGAALARGRAARGY